MIELPDYRAWLFWVVVLLVIVAIFKIRERF